MYQFWLHSYVFPSSSLLEKEKANLQNGIYSNFYQSFAFLISRSLRNYSQKVQGPSLALSCLIKQKGLSKNLQNFLYDLGIGASYLTLWRNEKKVLPEWKKEIESKIPGAGSWLDNFARLYRHCSIDRGKHFIPMPLLNNPGTYDSLQLSAMGIISPPALRMCLPA